MTRKAQSYYLLVVWLGVAVAIGVPGLLASKDSSCSARSIPPSSEWIESHLSFEDPLEPSLTGSSKSLDVRLATFLRAFCDLSEPDEQDFPEDFNDLGQGQRLHIDRSWDELCGKNVHSWGYVSVESLTFSPSYSIPRLLSRSPPRIP